MLQVHSLAWDLPHALGVSNLNKQKQKKKNSSLRKIASKTLRPERQNRSEDLWSEALFKELTVGTQDSQ